MTAPTYEQVAALFEQHAGPAAPALTRVLRETFHDPEEQRVAMLKYLHQAIDTTVPLDGYDAVKKAQALRNQLETLEVGEPAGSATEAVAAGIEPQVASPAITKFGDGATRPIQWFDRIFEQEGLNTADVAVASYLWRRAGKRLVCWPKQDDIAKACHVEVRTVNYALERLKALGAVTWKKASFRGPNTYTLHPPEKWTPNECANRQHRTRRKCHQ